MSRSSPGRYALHEFAKNAYNFRATGEDGRTVTVSRPNNHQWDVSPDTVALRHMTALRTMDQVDVAQRQLDSARQNLRIVNTGVETGAAAGTEGSQAEVDLGRAEVGMIQAQRYVRQAKLLLAERLGVSLTATASSR
jgi:predicted metalloprotease with PDZ domain